MRVLKFIGILLALLVAAALVLPFVIDANQFRPRLESELTQGLGRQVTLGNLKLSLLSGGVSAQDLSIADDPGFSKSAFLSAKALTVGVELQPLIFSRKLKVTGITIDQPQISLIQNAAGTWNFATLGGKKSSAPAAGEAPSGPPPEFSVKEIKIIDGRISLQRAGDSTPQVLEKLAVEIRDFEPHAAFPFSLSASVQGGGDLSLDGKAGPIDDADASATTFEANLKLSKLDMIKTGFVKPSTGFGGLLSMQGNARSNGRAVTLSGNAELEQLKLVAQGKPASKPVDLEFAIQHDVPKRGGILQRGNIHIGKGTAAITGTYREQGDSTVIDMRLAAPSIQVEELDTMLSAMNIVLPRGSSLQGGFAHANITVQGATNTLISKGSIGLTKTRLVGFDLGSKMQAVAAIAGLKISPDTDFENISVDVNNGPKGTAIDNLSILAPAIGELTGAGTISPAQAIDFKMRAKLVTAGGLLARTGSKQTTVPFSIQGTSNDPKFIPDVKGLATGIATGLVERKLNTIAPGEAGKAASDLLNNLFRKKKE